MRMTSTTPPAATHGGGLLIDSIRFRYPSVEGLVPADLLNGVSFRVPEESAGVILGAADAGKTTLTRILTGLIPRFTGGRLQGSAVFGTLDLLAVKPSEMMDSVGVVFQDPDEQLITTRCDSEAAFALESLGVPRREIGDRVSRGLGLMGLESLRGRNPGTLSRGGEEETPHRPVWRRLIPCSGSLMKCSRSSITHGGRLFSTMCVAAMAALFYRFAWSPLYQTSSRTKIVLANGRTLETTSPTGVEERLFATDPMEAAGLVLPREPFPKAKGGTDTFLKADNIVFRFPGRLCVRDRCERTLTWPGGNNSPCRRKWLREIDVGEDSLRAAGAGAQGGCCSANGLLSNRRALGCSNGTLPTFSRTPTTRFSFRPLRRSSPSAFVI